MKQLINIADKSKLYESSYNDKDGIIFFFIGLHPLLRGLATDDHCDSYAIKHLIVLSYH